MRTVQINWHATENSELLEEAQITGVEPADVIDTMANHAEALHPESGSKSAPAFGIKPKTLQHSRIDHAATHHLEPAGV